MTTIKKTSNLIGLYILSNLKEDKFIKKIISELIKNDIIEDDNSSWGNSIKDIIDNNIEVETIINIIHSAGIEIIKYDTFNNFLELILVGDGDCPVCGDIMDVDDVMYAPSIDPDCEPIENNKTYKCYNCGYTNKIK